MRDARAVGVLGRRVRVGGLIGAVALAGMGGRGARGLDSAAVGGDVTRTAFGPGTGIIVGLIDSGVSFSQPAIDGKDSQGNPRLVAEANFVATEPTNTGQDVFGHGTEVMSVIGSSDPTQLGMAPDVRYVDSRVLASNGTWANPNQLINGIGFALTNGANVITMSLSYANNFGGDSTSTISLLSDYVADTLGIPVVCAAGNSGGSATHNAPAPADAYNIFSVASSARATHFNSIVGFSSYGVEPDGTVRPNITAIGDSVVIPNEYGGYSTTSGTSFAAPQVTGMLASQIEYGKANGLSIDPRILRATMMNSATKINNRNNQPWSPAAASTVNGVYTVTTALDDNSGAGQINGAALVQQYEAGQHGPGNVPAIGWDLNTINGATGKTDYTITGNAAVGSTISATLVWNQHITYRDLDHNGVIDNLDAFDADTPISNFDLNLFCNGKLIATSDGSLDTIEQLHWMVTTPGTYEVEVSRLNVDGAVADETYGLAWNLTAVPEPGSLVTWMGGVVGIVGWRRRQSLKYPC